MTTSMILIVPVLVLAVVVVFAFAGCAAFAGADEPKELAPAREKYRPGLIDLIRDPNQTPATTYADSVGNDAGLRCWWRLDEPDGSLKARDSDTKKLAPLDGDYKPGATVNMTAAGMLADDASSHFDGAAQFVELAYSPLLNPTPAPGFSVEAWVSPELTAPGRAEVVGSYEPLAFLGFALEVVRANTGAMTAQVRVGDGTKFTVLAVDLGTGTPNGWRHVVATYSSSAAATELHLYVNSGAGQFHNQLTTPNTYKPVDGQFKPPFRIGAGRVETAPAPPGAPPQHFFPGRIDEVALYDAVLGPKVVQDHFDLATNK